LCGAAMRKPKAKRARRSPQGRRRAVARGGTNRLKSQENC
jgi:hypothetical protein